MITDPRNIAIGARYESEIFGRQPYGVLEFCSGENDYQGSEAFVAKLNDGRWMFYEWSYGSCSGCDHWENETLEQCELDWKNGPAVMDAESFADFLINCINERAYWLFRRYVGKTEKVETPKDVLELLEKVHKSM